MTEQDEAVQVICVVCCPSPACDGQRCSCLAIICVASMLFQVACCAERQGCPHHLRSMLSKSDLFRKEQLSGQHLHSQHIVPGGLWCRDKAVHIICVICCQSRACVKEQLSGQHLHSQHAVPGGLWCRDKAVHII